MSAIDTDTPAVIEPTQILGLIESLSRIGNKSVELQRAVNEFVSYDEDIIKIVYITTVLPLIKTRGECRRDRLCTYIK